MCAPASFSAAIFSAAVPELPVMIAPACPMRLPGGALLPDMKATTGFDIFSLMKECIRLSTVRWVHLLN